MKTDRFPLPGFPCRSRLMRATLLPWLLGALFASQAFGQAEGDKPLDYFAARGSNRLAVVESYHLGPCQRNYAGRDWPRALSECNFILKLYPNHPAALLLVSQVCEQWKSGACLLDDVFERAVAINPKAPGTFVVQGIYLNRTKQFAAAIQRFNLALELDPDNMNAHYNLALTYLDANQFELANVHAHRAYDLGATPPGLRNRLQQAGYWKPVDPASVRSDAASSHSKPAGGKP
jgi:tetratricopeptide (TPR) repeat protein